MEAAFEVLGYLCQGLTWLRWLAQVPGEMFALAMQAAKQRGMGCVGSTQNILDFIAARLQEACARPFPDTLQARARCLASYAMAAGGMACSILLA